MKYILFTIDTEIGEYGNSMDNSFELFFQGKIKNKELGYKYIINKLDEYGFKGEFFVDVYPKDKKLSKKIETAVKFINKKGHGVQLHTHPSLSYDNNRIRLNQYSLKEQIEIITYGKELIKTWVGKYPLAHRAGVYGINEDSFKALNRNDIKYDFSYFYGNENCKINKMLENKIFKKNGVIEIPVTITRITKQYKLLGFPILKRKVIRKLDINALTFEQMKDTISKAPDNSILVFFMHSFSFIKNKVNTKNHIVEVNGVDSEAILKFNNILKYIKNNNILTNRSIKELIFKL